MKKITSTLIIALLSSTLSIAAFARTKNTAKITLPELARIAGKQLAPGDYTLRWTGSAPNVNVTFLQDNKQVASAPATLLTKSPYTDAVDLQTTSSNQKLIRGVYVNSHLALMFVPTIGKK